jgi:hypothetical protein
MILFLKKIYANSAISDANLGLILKFINIRKRIIL